MDSDQPGNSSSPRRLLAARTRDAAFYGLVLEDKKTLEVVRDQLALQPTQPNMNFDRRPWCPMSSVMRNSGSPYFGVTHAMLISLHSFDYIDIAIESGLISDWSPSQRASLTAWYLGWAAVTQPAMDDQAGLPFVDRLNGDYTPSGLGADRNNLWTSWTYSNPTGPKLHRAHNIWHNRRASMARYIAVAGVKFDDEFYIDRGWRWLRDWFRYHVYPHGVNTDIHRGASNANVGMAYMTLGGAHVFTGVDTLARAGKGRTNLYELETDVGLWDSAGFPHDGDVGKGPLFWLQSMARHASSDFAHYHRRNNNGNRFNFREPASQGAHDRAALPANIWYQDQGLTRDYYRGENGQPSWRVNGNGATDLNDAWAYPSPYLMWAGLEGKIWPFPDAR